MMFQKFLLGFLLIAGWACNPSKYYQLGDFQQVPKIDTHVHIRSDSFDFVKQAIKDNFKLVNIVVDGAGTWSGVQDQFEYSLLHQNAYPDHFKTISAFSVENFKDADWSQTAINWMDLTFAKGAIGIKVWKNIGMVLQDSSGQNVMLDDPRFDEIFDYLEKEKKIVIGHLGEPLNCWLPLEEMTTNNDRSYFSEHPQYHMYKHPESPSYHDQMQARDNRLDRHQNLRFIGAHMASLEWNVDTLAAWLDRYPNASIDLAARMGQVFFQSKENREKVRDFFIKYQDQILYGTDLGDNGKRDPKSLVLSMQDTWKRDWKYFVSDQMMESSLINGAFQGIQLPKTVVDKIYYANAARLFGWEGNRMP